MQARRRMNCSRLLNTCKMVSPSAARHNLALRVARKCPWQQNTRCILGYAALQHSRPVIPGQQVHLVAHAAAARQHCRDGQSQDTTRTTATGRRAPSDVSHCDLEREITIRRESRPRTVAAGHRLRSEAYLAAHCLRCRRCHLQLQRVRARPRASNRAAHPPNAQMPNVLNASVTANGHMLRDS